MTQPTFYHRDGEYTALTGESPKNFPNLFGAFTGPSPSTIKETCFPLNALGDRVEVNELPEDWATAFKNAGIKISEPEPEPEPEPKTKTRGIREEELLTHVASGLDPLTALAASVDDVEPEEYPEWHPVAIVVIGIILSCLLRLSMGY